MMNHSIYHDTFDAATELKDAGAVTANNTAGTVASVARVVNVGTGIIDAVLVVHLDTVDVASTDEAYEIVLQGSTAANFGSGVSNLRIVHAGLAAVNGEPANVTSGTIRVPVSNTLDGLTALPYLRVLTKVVGTTPSINYRAYLTKNPT